MTSWLSDALELRPVAVVSSSVQWKPSYVHSESDGQLQVRELCKREVVSIVLVH